MIQQLVTTKVAAAYLGVSASFLEKDRWRGSRIPFVRIGARTIKYRLSDLDAFINNQVMHSTSEYAS